MFPIHDLPPELFELVFDHLSDDPASLKTCSLVCRQWLRPTRDRAFHSLTIPIGLGASRSPYNWHWRYEVAMHILFSPFATLFPSVQTLTLDSLLDFASSARTLDPDDLLILKYFRNLRHLQIRRIPMPYPRSKGTASSNEKAIPLPIHDTEAITSLTLNRVGFESFDQLHHFVVSFPNLQHLAITPISETKENWRLVVPSPMSLFLPMLPRSLNISLRQLSLDDTLFRWTSGGAGRLETLEISRITLPQWRDCGRLHPFLLRHTSIKKLVLRFGVGRMHLPNVPEPYAYPLVSAAPPTFTQLRAVEFSSFYFHPPGWAVFNVLLYSFSEISSAYHTLEMLRLVFNCSFKPRFGDGAGWTQIDEVLGNFTRLKYVEVVIRCKTSIAESVSEELEVVRGYLSSYSRRGVLHIMPEYVDILPFDSG
ncbi:hypothetical protein AX16_003349 [Volvariella volvacea WC 439]|nr:hypothetical protein AX16_003349 [Volvariella volvacea WC 439]